MTNETLTGTALSRFATRVLAQVAAMETRARLIRERATMKGRDA